MDVRTDEVGRRIGRIHVGKLECADTHLWKHERVRGTPCTYSNALSVVIAVPRTGRPERIILYR